MTSDQKAIAGDRAVRGEGRLDDGVLGEEAGEADDA